MHKTVFVRGATFDFNLTNSWTWNHYCNLIIIQQWLKKIPADAHHQPLTVCNASSHSIPTCTVLGAPQRRSCSSLPPKRLILFFFTHSDVPGI